MKIDSILNETGKKILDESIAGVLSKAKITAIKIQYQNAESGTVTINLGEWLEEDESEIDD